MTKPTKQRLRIFNIGNGGFAFAINEETGDTVFLSRQLCAAHEITEEDVGQHIECLVGDGEKGPQAITVDFVDDRVEPGIIEVLRSELSLLKDRVTHLEELHRV